MDNNEHRRRRLSPGNRERIAHDHSNREREREKGSDAATTGDARTAAATAAALYSTPSGRHLFLSLSLSLFVFSMNFFPAFTHSCSSAGGVRSLDRSVQLVSPAKKP